MRTAILSFHSHRDRSFLDDRELALLSGDLRREGRVGDLVVAVIDPDAEPTARADALDALARALRTYDVVLYERVWSRDIVASLAARLDGATFVHAVGEHVLDDPPGRYRVRGELRTTFPLLLAHLEGHGPLPGGVEVREGDGFREGLGRRGERSALPFEPNLHPIVVPEGALAPSRSFSIVGNAGCPYRADARDNPLYAGVTMPDGMGRGCAFCTTGNRYEARPHAETAARIVEQITWVRRRAPERTRLVLKDQNPFAYLPRVLEGVRDADVGGFTLLLETRADWFLESESKLEEALAIAETARVKIAPFLVGIESFSQAELDRFNKGVTAADNERFLERLRAWDAAHPAFELGEASFGFVLFSPWTTLEDLRINHDAIVRTRFHELRGHVLLSRARLYPDTALYHLARRDGLLAGAPSSGPVAARYGYYPETPYRFAHDDVARFEALAAEELRAAGGRDEMAIFGRLLARFEAPARASSSAPGAPRASRASRASGASRAPGASRASGGSGASIHVYLGGVCGLSCAACDCREGDGKDPVKAIRRGGQRLELRGGSRGGLDPRALVKEAREAGFSEVVFRTHAIALRNDRAARALREAGIDTVLVPLFSEDAAVHDRLAGREGAMAAALSGLTNAAAAGLAVELEVPLLPRALQDTEALVARAMAHVPAIGSVRFYVPRHRIDAKLAPEPWPELAPRLARAMARCRAHGVATPLPPTSGIPLCALRAFPDEEASFRARPKGRTRVGGATHVAGCAGCAAERACAGLARSHVDAHGDAVGVAPFARAPLHLFDKKKRERVWTDDEKDAARGAKILVLRPTVHCNQDCGFCSANETTKNVWPDPDEMARKIARAADRGVRRVSFSGGEPTLSKHLVGHVEVARRAGIREVEIVTNGVLLDREEKVDALVRAGLTHAFVSVHAHTEALSSALTQKRGDFARTTRAVDHLIARGVRTTLNHVVNARTYRSLREYVRLVRERWGGEALISFAFVTPQYKALENLFLVPRMSDVRPFLRVALREALALGQPFVIGSRQGLPPCQLDEFAGWSDVLELVEEAISEDGPQKTKAPACATCRYDAVCTGVWKPYAERHGLAELAPIEGEPIDGALRTQLLGHAQKSAWGVPMAFEDVHPTLRRTDLEARPLDDAQAALLAETAPDRVSLPVLRRSRALRIGIAGTSARARHLVTALGQLDGVAVAAAASPHAERALLPELGHSPRYTDVRALLDDTIPDALVVASSTASHAEVAGESIARGVPVMVEKPLADSREEAEALVAHAAERGVPLFVAHNLLGSPALGALLREAARDRRAVSVARLVPLESPDAPRTFAVGPLYETLVHLTGLLAHAGFSADATAEARFTGGGAPERLAVTFEDRGRRGEVVLEIAPRDVLSVRVAGRDGPDGRDAQVFEREGRDARLLDAAGAVRALERRGSDVEVMLSTFRDAILGDARGTPNPDATTHDTSRHDTPSPDAWTPDDVLASGAEGVAAMVLAERALEALASAGAPLSRPTAPRHAATKDLVRGVVARTKALGPSARAAPLRAREGTQARKGTQARQGTQARPTAADPHALASAEPSALAPVDPHALASAEPHALASAEPSALAPVDPHALASAEPHALASAEPSALASAEPHALASAEPHALAPIVPLEVPSFEPFELLAFRAGHKPVLFATVRPEEEARVVASLGPGVHVVRAERRVARDARDVWRDDRVSGEPRVELFASRDPALAERARALQLDDPTEHAEALGALLGYPDCCVRAFVALESRADNSATRFAIAARTTAAPPWPAALNDLALKVVPFFPCRYDCEPARHIAERTLDLLDADARDAVASFLARPVLYAHDGEQLHFEGRAAPDGRVTYSRLHPRGREAARLARWLATGDAITLEGPEITLFRGARALGRLVLEGADRAALFPFGPGTSREAKLS